MKYKCIGLSVTVMLLCIKLSARDEFASCRLLLENYVKMITSITVPTGEMVFVLKYTYEVKYKKATGKADVRDDCHYFISKKKLFYTSSGVKIFSDEKNGFMIVPLSKRIIWTNGGKLSSSTEQFKTMASFEDSVMRHAEVANCISSFSNGKSYRMITLLPALYIKNASHVTRIIYQYNETDKKIEKVTCYFDEYSDMISTSMTYNEINLSASQKLSSAYNQVFNAHSKLKSEFSDFELIDNRTEN